MKVLILTNFDVGLYQFRKELIEELIKKNKVFISLPYGDLVEPLKKMGCKFIDTTVDRRGINPKTDISLFFRFTSSEYAVISAFGITEPGKEYEAVENGIIVFGGSKPINASGGLIGCGHPVGASGARIFFNLYKQVTEQAGFYQVNCARNGMMLNIGGSATTNYVFVIGRE